MVKEYGPEELVAAARESCRSLGHTFNYRGLNVAETILKARHSRAENEQKQAEELAEGRKQLQASKRAKVEEELNFEEAWKIVAGEA